jgi:glycosyltransferase involved in cell wall biosynthesis
MIKCSIIIPNYNQGHFLERSVSSAVAQTIDKSETEIIIVDDGSKDNSLLLAQSLIYKFGDSNIRLIKKKNGGTASARNAGILESSGEYIGFLDADDEYHVQKAEISIKYLDIAPEVGLVYSDYIEVFSNKTMYNSKPDFDERLLKRQCIVSTNSFIKRSVVNKIGLFNESIKLIEDYDYWLRISAANFMCMRIPAPLFKYYNHGQNKTLTAHNNDIAREHAMLRR